MDGRYNIGRFARRAGVTVRTLRHYDAVGLLRPAARTEAGYRVYTDTDLLTLQHILALKTLGLSLEEIRGCLRAGPADLATTLAAQKRALQEKRDRLDAVLSAIERTERLVAEGQCDWQAVARVIEVMHMEQETDWVKEYFTPEQLAKMEELREGAYSEEAAARLRQRTWTAEDQKRVDAQWAALAADANRLAAAGADPAGPEGQALAQRKVDLLRAFTQDDPEIEAGLRAFWERLNALPEADRPLTALPGATPEGAAFLASAMTARQA